MAPVQFLFDLRGSNWGMFLRVVVRKRHGAVHLLFAAAIFCSVSVFDPYLPYDDAKRAEIDSWCAGFQIIALETSYSLDREDDALPASEDSFSGLKSLSHLCQRPSCLSIVQISVLKHQLLILRC